MPRSSQKKAWQPQQQGKGRVEEMQVLTLPIGVVNDKAVVERCRDERPCTKSVWQDYDNMDSQIPDDGVVATVVDCRSKANAGVHIFGRVTVVGQEFPCAGITEIDDFSAQRGL